MNEKGASDPLRTAMTGGRFPLDWMAGFRWTKRPDSLEYATIPVPEQIAQGLVPRERLNDLLCGPLLRSMRCDGKVHHLAPLMGEDDEDKEHLEVHGGYHEEVDGHQYADRIFQKRFPGQ